MVFGIFYYLINGIAWYCIVLYCVIGFGARAVSRKTPIYFIYFSEVKNWFDPWLIFGDNLVSLDLGDIAIQCIVVGGRNFEIDLKRNDSLCYLLLPLFQEVFVSRTCGQSYSFENMTFWPINQPTFFLSTRPERSGHTILSDFQLMLRRWTDEHMSWCWCRCLCWCWYWCLSDEQMNI